MSGYGVELAGGQLDHPLASLPVKRPLLSDDMEIIEQQLRDLGYL